MRSAVRVVLWVAGILFGLFVLVMLIGVTPWVVTGAFHLVVGWVTHATTVLPKVTINWSGVGMMAVCLGLAGAIGHRFCAWLWKGGGHEEPWRPRWTAAGLGAIVLMFAAGMAFTAVAHQTGWLLRSEEPLISSGSNIRNASSSLKTIVYAQADFRANDRDNNRIQDFWRGDIAGLYTVKAGGVAIKLIELSVAAADDRPVTDIQEFAEPGPKAGYRYRALKYRGETTPDPQRFAACAYPVKPPGGPPYMFIVNEEGTLWRKICHDFQPPEFFPDDLLKDGWSKLD